MKPIYLISLLFIASCAQDTSEQKPLEKSELEALKQTNAIVEVKPQELTKNMIKVTGTIVFKNIEGGIIGLETKDGKKYTPRNLKPQHRRPGLVLEVTGVINEDLLSYKQYGQMLEVKSVKVIDDSNIGGTSNEY